jgi:hypothetical protein
LTTPIELTISQRAKTSKWLLIPLKKAKKQKAIKVKEYHSANENDENILNQRVMDPKSFPNPTQIK